MKWYELANKHQCKESAHHKQLYDQKMRTSRLDHGDLYLVWEKAFTGKHKIGDNWENTKYVEQQHNLPVYTIKPWQGDGKIHVVHRNLLMHIAPPNQQEGVQPGLEDSNSNTLLGRINYLNKTQVQLDQWYRVKLGLTSCPKA